MNGAQASNGITIPQIIRNDRGVYEGDLREYSKILMAHARNLEHPYHNFRHMLHVVFLCHDACLFYRDRLSLRDGRLLLIAAMFHDFNHVGRTGNDDVNITLALRALDTHILSKDRLFLQQIGDMVLATQYPYTSASHTLSPLQQILRDADACQAFDTAWIQQVGFGLGEETGLGWRTVLGMQKKFLGEIAFSTDWARQKFPPDVIQAKINEAEELLALL